MNTQPNLTLHFDGGARGNPGPAAAGVVLRSDGGEALLEAGYLLGNMTNNQAEYSALLIGVRAANQCGAEQLTIYGDSELLVKQLTGQYRVKSEGLLPLFEDAQQLLQQVRLWRIHHVPRHQNARADELLNRALDTDEDVIEVQSLEGPPALTARPDQAAANAQRAGTKGDRARRVIIEVVREATANACPTSCISGSRFVIEDLLPAGLNLDLAAKLLERINILRGPTQRGERAEPAMVICSRCGAKLQVSLT